VPNTAFLMLGFPSMQSKSFSYDFNESTLMRGAESPGFHPILFSKVASLKYK
jgi:hypothetical protein